MPDDLLPRLQRSLGDAFKIERELGGGGMARVFLSTETALERQIVVKVLDLEGAVAASAERFRREVKVIAQLQHPHVVPVLSAGGDDTLLWYAMPFVSGESLRARLVREGALPLADALRIARETLDALSAAHARGIVHRDIKPENILLEGRHAVVADFGVAKALADAGVGSGLTSAGLALGTPAYMAPEQALGDATTNHRADLYAVGAVLYEMLVGAPPYSGNAQAVVAAHLTAPIPRVEDRRTDVPPAIAQLVHRLMAKNPAERPQSAHEAMTALEEVTTPGGSTLAFTSGAAAGVAAGEVARTLRHSTYVRSPGRARWRLVAAAVLLVGLGGLSWWKTRAPKTDYATGADVIVVMPLGSTGDSALARLGRDLVVTVSANLDGVGALRAVDAMSVLSRAGALPQPLSLDDARELGAALGASSVVHGSLIPEGEFVRVDIGLFPVGGGDALARLSTRGATHSIGALTDSISTELLRQIWRRGTPPSPVLSEMTTSSNEALRAFLEGERFFELFDVTSALASYARATTLDSMFAQAWLRRSMLRGLAVMPVDSEANRRVDSLLYRLPQRDQELWTLARTPMPLRDRFAAQKVIAARYPEYHTAQYRAGDLAIHNGPRVGIAITEALPYIERLDQLAPRHADNAQHRLMLAMAIGDTVEMLRAARDFADRSPGPSGIFARSLHGAIARYDSTGEFQSQEDVLAFLRAAMAMTATAPALQSFFLMGAPWLVTPDTWDATLSAVGRDPEFRALSESARFGRAVLAFGRGDASRAIQDLAEFEKAPGDVTLRLSAVRAAAWGAWLGISTQAELDVALRRARTTVADAGPLATYELGWAEGLAAITAQDSLRFETAIRAITDTANGTRHMVRGLRALWRERRTKLVDSLIAVDDDGMAQGLANSTAMPLHRVAIGRALTAAGDPRRAEYYMQWTDGMPTTARLVLIEESTANMLSYERGLAAEAAGDRRAAILHLQRFVGWVDRPGPALQQQVADAKQRLARLTAAQR